MSAKVAAQSSATRAHELTGATGIGASRRATAAVIGSSFASSRRLSRALRDL